MAPALQPKDQMGLLPIARTPAFVEGLSGPLGAFPFRLLRHPRGRHSFAWGCDCPPIGRLTFLSARGPPVACPPMTCLPVRAARDFVGPFQFTDRSRSGCSPDLITPATRGRRDMGPAAATGEQDLGRRLVRCPTFEPRGPRRQSFRQTPSHPLPWVLAVRVVFLTSSKLFRQKMGWEWRLAFVLNRNRCSWFRFPLRQIVMAVVGTCDGGR